MISLFSNLLLTPFTLHALGDAQYGLFVLISSFAIQGAILDLGIAPAVIKYVAEAHAQRDYDLGRSVIATALSLYCALALVVLLLATAIAALFPYVFSVPPSFQASATIAVLIMGVQLAISLPLAIPGAILWGSHRYVQSQAIGLFATLLAAASTVTALLAGGGIISLFAANTLAAAGAAGGRYLARQTV